MTRGLGRPDTRCIVELSDCHPPPPHHRPPRDKHETLLRRQSPHLVRREQGPAQLHRVHRGSPSRPRPATALKRPPVEVNRLRTGHFEQALGGFEIVRDKADLERAVRGDRLVATVDLVELGKRLDGDHRLDPVAAELGDRPAEEVKPAPSGKLVEREQESQRGRSAHSKLHARGEPLDDLEKDDPDQAAESAAIGRGHDPDRGRHRDSCVPSYPADATC